MVLPVAGIFGYFGGAVGALFLLLFFFLLYIPEACNRWEATGLHGEDTDSPGCQHPQSDQSPQRQLPVFAAGPLDHQRWLAGLSEVLKSFPTISLCIRVHLQNVRGFFDSLRTQPRCLNCHRMSQYASSSFWTLSSPMLHNTEWLSARLASPKPIR